MKQVIDQDCDQHMNSSHLSAAAELLWKISRTKADKHLSSQAGQETSCDLICLPCTESSRCEQTYGFASLWR